MNIDTLIFADIFIISYLLFCLFWFQNFTIRFFYKYVNWLGLAHDWPMFVEPQLQNPYISCTLQFKDGTSKNYVFSDFNSKSIIHRKYIDSLYVTDFLRSGLADHIINFSGVKNIENVYIEVEKTKIKPYNDYWNEAHKQQ